MSGGINLPAAAKAPGATNSRSSKPSQKNLPPDAVGYRTSPTRNRGLLGQVEDAYAKPLDFSGMQTVTAGTGGGSQGVTFSNPFDSRYRKVDFNNPFNPGYQGVDFQRGTQGVDFQRGTQGVDFTNPGMFRGVRGTDFEGIGNRFELGRPNDYGAERQSIEQATFDRAMHLLRPELDRQESRVRTDLANRGLPDTSEAHRDLYGQFSDRRGRALTDLSLASVLAGAQEHQRLADLTSRNRAQLMGEGAQRYGEDRGIRQQQALEANQRAGQQLGLRGIEAGEASAIMGAQNQLRGTQAQEAANLMNAMLGLRGQQQTGDIARMQGHLGLSGLQRQDAANRAGQQLGLRQAQRAEDAQRFSQQMALRQQQIAEARLKRAQPTNDLASLLAGTVTNPAMPSYTNYAIQSPDYMGLVGSNYAARANARSSGLGGMFGLAGSVLSGLG